MSHWINVGVGIIMLQFSIKFKKSLKNKWLWTKLAVYFGSRNTSWGVDLNVLLHLQNFKQIKFSQNSKSLKRCFIVFLEKFTIQLFWYKILQLSYKLMLKSQILKIIELSIEFFSNLGLVSVYLLELRFFSN